MRELALERITLRDLQRMVGWHYAVDGYVAIAATIVLWWGVGRPLKTANNLTQQY